MIAKNLTHLCDRILWLRTTDVRMFASGTLPKLAELHCEVTLVSSDGDNDVPAFLPPAAQAAILSSKWVKAWYAQKKNWSAE